MTWKTARLEEVAEVVAGNPAPQNATDFCEGGEPFVRMQDVGREHRTSNLTVAVDKVSADAIARHRLRLFPVGSVLVPKSGASVNLNHRAMLGRDAYVVSHLAVLVPNRDRVIPEYLYAWSQAYDPRHQAQTTSLPSLPLSLIKAAGIPVPSIPEQLRIVDILSRADGIVRLRREAERKAAELIPALFLDMFGDPATNPKGWPMKTVGDVIESADYGSSTKASDDGSGLPLIRMGNVDFEGTLKLTALKFVNLPNAEAEKYRLRAGDILFNRTNSKDLVGKTGLWSDEREAVVASYFIRLRVDRDRLHPCYLWAFMNSRHMKRVLFDTARGAIGQANINSKELKAFPVAVPPLQLQQNYAARLEDIRSIQSQQSAASAKAQATFDALLAQTFSGVH